MYLKSYLKEEGLEKFSLASEGRIRDGSHKSKFSFDMEGAVLGKQWVPP